MNPFGSQSECYWVSCSDFNSLPMHIFFVLTPAFDPYGGGVQMSTHKIGSYMAAQGHEVSIYSFATKGHVTPHHMTLHHDALSGGFQHVQNITHMQECLQGSHPDVVIN